LSVIFLKPSFVKIKKHTSQREARFFSNSSATQKLEFHKLLYHTRWENEENYFPTWWYNLLGTKTVGAIEYAFGWEGAGLKKFLEKPSKFYFHYPFPVAVVGVKAGDTVNFMSAAWHTQLSFDPPLYGVAVSPKRFTATLLGKTSEFSLNFLDFNDYQLAGIFGRLSGREVDKSRVAEGEWVLGKILRVPILERAISAYECKLVQSVPFGDHILYVGEIVGVHYVEEYFQGGIGKSTLLYAGNDRYSFADVSKTICFTKEDALETLRRLRSGSEEQ